MRALVVHAPDQITKQPLILTELPTPTPGARELLIRVRACGVCRTDLHVIEGELPAPALPLIPGHQVVGTIESLGEGCTRWRAGERVGVPWLHSTCGRCEDCVRGRENLCAQSRYTGYQRNGGFAEYIVAHEDFVYRIPDEFSDVEATPLLCAGIIGYRALVRSELPSGGSLTLFGFGSSAHMTIQVARAQGATVYVATRGESHRALARKLGAAWVGDAFDTPPALTDSAIVFAPAGELVPAALRAVKRGGTVALAGIHMSDIPAMSYAQHLFHEKNLRSVEANTREDGKALLATAAQIPIRPTVTTFPLAQGNAVLAALKADKINGTAVLVP
ncbi:MAG: zinc-binding alcohol dehydrogenase family protein [Proteobacteria bacterium]|nr:zinc-binding alcohol dehydrogenase family protein [Pseudomonadota bacterium]